MKTYFYEKEDGTIFACEDKEAEMLESKNARGQQNKLIGVSDGKQYKTVMAEGEPEILDAKEKYMNADKISDKAKALKEYQNIQKKWTSKAFNAELEVARGKLSQPPSSRGEFWNMPEEARGSVEKMVKK